MKTNTIHINIQISSKEIYETLGTLLRTDPNMAVRVSKVVIVIVTRPEIYGKKMILVLENLVIEATKACFDDYIAKIGEST